jgi:hypothetical protein
MQGNRPKSASQVVVTLQNLLDKIRGELTAPTPQINGADGQTALARSEPLSKELLPDLFMCPITLEAMVDPVIASDGCVDMKSC